MDPFTDSPVIKIQTHKLEKPQRQKHCTNLLPTL